MSEPQLERITPEGYPDFLADIADKLDVWLQESGLKTPTSAEIAFKITERIREEWSGEQIYLPKGLHFEINQKHRDIYAKFRGDNHQQLAKEYDLTVVQIYKIIRTVAAANFTKRQQGLFNDAAQGEMK